MRCTNYGALNSGGSSLASVVRSRLGRKPLVGTIAEPCFESSALLSRVGHADDMESKMLTLACGLLLMPIMANARSPDADIAGPTAFRVTEPLRWRDGYINWRGRKIFEPDWRTFKADNGTTFVVDMKSIANIGHNGLLVRAVAYLVEGEDFDPNDLITFAFNCKDFVEVATNTNSERVRSVEKQVRELACH
jgi:hypothetical protein